MNILESIVSSYSSVMSNKMRSILTMLGIIIGISSVIMITSIGQGFQSSITEQFEQLGMQGLQISVNYNETISDTDRLRFSDMDVIKNHPLIENVSALWAISGSVYLRNPKETGRASFYGTDENYRMVQKIDMVQGRFITEQDVTKEALVAVIDESLSKKVFGRSNSIGEKIKATFWSGTVELTVVGITKAPEFSDMFSVPSIIYMPVKTLMGLYNSDYVDYFMASAKDTTDMDKIASEVTRLLSIKHNNEKKYRVDNLMKQMDEISSILGNVTGFVVLVAAISLVVGGIGVMNIMLVTVTERTREIGIRKSLGAGDGNILFQFLVEAVILTAIGGTIGIILGYVGAFALGQAIKIIPKVSVSTVMMTVIVSSIIGIISGVYPAYKAAKLDPIEALRYE